jgi:hypothetical protein
MTAEVHSACASVAGGALRLTPPEQFQREIALENVAEKKARTAGKARPAPAGKDAAC